MLSTAIAVDVLGLALEVQCLKASEELLKG